MSLLPQRAAEKMRSGTCLHTDQGGLYVRGISQELLPCELFPHKHLAGSTQERLAKPDAMDQLHESMVAADRIEVWMGLDELEDIGLLLVSLIEPVEDLFVVT